MVFFTCNHCGDSLKKAAVDKHYNTRCRGAVKFVSCMDCLKDFRAEEYAAHTKCITEAQKYSGKNYVPKESNNSGAKKQEEWMDIVRNILATSEYNLSAAVRNAFQKLQNVDNVPRKKVKFQNFAWSCLRLPKQLSEEVWDVLEKELEKMKQAKTTPATSKEQEQCSEQQNGEKRTASEQNGYVESTKKKAKQNASVENTDSKPENEVTDALTEADNEVFDWSTLLERLMTKHAEGIPMEKLKKKALKKYTRSLQTEALTEKQQRKFEKKFVKHVKKSPTLQVNGEIVKCI